MAGYLVHLVREAEGVKKEIKEEGSFYLGRGPMLGITDKRVSRKQLELVVDNDEGVHIICVLPLLPCYLSLSVGWECVCAFVNTKIWVECCGVATASSLTSVLSHFCSLTYPHL